MGLGQWPSLEKISLHSSITSIPPGFDLMNDPKRTWKKLAQKHEVNEKTLANKISSIFAFFNTT